MLKLTLKSTLCYPMRVEIKSLASTTSPKLHAWSDRMALSASHSIHSSSFILHPSLLLSLSPVANIFITTRARDSIAAIARGPDAARAQLSMGNRALRISHEVGRTAHSGHFFALPYLEVGSHQICINNSFLLYAVSEGRGLGVAYMSGSMTLHEIGSRHLQQRKRSTNNFLENCRCDVPNSSRCQTRKDQRHRQYQDAKNASQLERKFLN